MISINKNGWLHKFNSFFSSSMKKQEETTLCNYFWHTVWNILKVIVFGSFIVLLLSVIGCAILAPLLGIPFGGSLYALGYLAYLSPLVGAAVFILVIGVIVGGGIGVGWVWKTLLKWVDSKTENIDVKTPEVLSLAVEFAKAKKQKYCPLIKIE